MKLLKLIGVLMDYPQAEVKTHAAELIPLVEEATQLPGDVRAALINLIIGLRDTDLLDSQSCYEGLFERGRSTSLLLFEHVHGDSRDRGQAMVDLMAVYERAGFMISVRELPDYLPLYLEFLAERPAEVAREGLQEVAHILRLLATRLAERQSPYACLFDALLAIAGEARRDAALQARVEGEVRDDTLEALDRVWEEEMVTFMGDDVSSSCGSQASPARSSALQESPVHWVSPSRRSSQAPTQAARAS